MSKEKLPWWQTNCPACRKARLMIFWLILMLLADKLWFHIIF